MNLLWFNLATDLDDPALGFTSGWIRAMAERVEGIDVITMRAGRVDLPDNVRLHSLGKEHGYGVPRRVLAFYMELFRTLRTRRIDACFSHMIPVFTSFAAPILRARRIPVLTWFAHPSVTVPVRLAHHLGDGMVTSLPTTYRYRRNKLTVIGQGIDTDFFSPRPEVADDVPMILCAGRLSPVKDHPTLLRAAALVRDQIGERFRLVVLGSPARPSDERYVDSLRNVIDELRLETVVALHPAVASEELLDWYRRCTLHVNLTPAGFGDKVALEAMACGRPSLVANEDFRQTLGREVDRLLFPHGDARALSERWIALLRVSHEARWEMGSFLRSQVEELHSLSALMERILTLLEELRSQPGSSGDRRV